MRCVKILFWQCTVHRFTRRPVTCTETAMTWVHRRTCARQQLDINSQNGLESRRAAPNIFKAAFRDHDCQLLKFAQKVQLNRIPSNHFRVIFVRSMSQRWALEFSTLKTVTKTQLMHHSAWTIGAKTGRVRPNNSEPCTGLIYNEHLMNIHSTYTDHCLKLTSYELY